jgi:arginine-tRNA-protein transferase
MSQRTVTLYRSATHPCPYLPAETAASAFVDPALELSPPLYGRLLEHGFRRSGVHVYRPACPGCSACRAVRIPVNDFRPRRSQRRAWRASAAGLALVPRPGEFVGEHYALYARYLAARHPDGGMAGGDAADYRRFAFADWCDTLCVELRLDDRLLAVAVTDRMPDALSAVYTFFDPDESGRSPGVLAILAQIELARRWGLTHLYLGYWIGACPKMAYKGEYRPLEGFGGEGWVRVGPGDAMMPPA